MRWKFKFKFNWDYLLTLWGNTGVGVTTAGIVAFIFHKPQSFSLLIIGTFIIFLASIGKSIKVD